jgi:hypothetical protein
LLYDRGEKEDGCMGEIVNLRTVKKQRAKAAAEGAAAANRVRHGRTGAEKKAAQMAEARRDKALDGLKLEEKR